MRTRSRRQPSFFMRMLISFLLIVALSLLFGYVVHSYTFQILEADISASHAASLHRAAGLVDAKLQELSSIFSQLSLDADINQSIETDHKTAALPPAELLAVRRRLEKVLCDGIEDLFVYYPRADKVIPRVYGTFPLEPYLRYYYPLSAGAHEGIAQALRRPNAMTLLALPGDHTVLVAQTLPIRNLAAAAAAGCAVLGRSYLSRLLQEWAPADGWILLADAAGNPLVSSGKESWTEPLTGRADNAAYYTQTLKGEDCIVQSVGSVYTGYRYLSVVPVRAFWMRLNKVRTVSLLTFGGFGLLSLLTAWLLAKRNYAPISDLVDEIRVNQPDAEAHRNEIEYIRRILRSTFDERQALRDVARDDLLRKALEGRLDPDLSPRGQLIRTLPLLSDRFAVFLLYPEQNPADELPSEIHDAAMRKILTDLCPPQAKLFVLSGNDGAFACVLNPARPGEPTARRLCELATAFFARSMNRSFSAAYGGEHEGFEGIRLSHLEALAALEHRAVQPPGSILAWNGVEASAFRYVFCARDEAERLLLCCIRKNQPDPARALSEIRLQCCGGQIRLPEEFKCYYFDMRDLLQRVADKLSISRALLEALDECDNLTSFDEALVDVLGRMRDTFCESSSTDTQRMGELCARVRAYIEENCGDASLSVPAVGRYFGFSGQYLSRVFREDQNMTIAACITNARMDRARRLLTESGRSVEEISEQCGFLSSTTFIRLFKKMEGLTPGAYRRAHGLPGGEG